MLIETFVAEHNQEHKNGNTQIGKGRSAFTSGHPA